jgi:hypothetical protein
VLLKHLPHLCPRRLQSRRRRQQRSPLCRPRRRRSRSPCCLLRARARAYARARPTRVHARTAGVRAGVRTSRAARTRARAERHHDRRAPAPALSAVNTPGAPGGTPALGKSTSWRLQRRSAGQNARQAELHARRALTLRNSSRAPDSTPGKPSRASRAHWQLMSPSSAGSTRSRSNTPSGRVSAARRSSASGALSPTTSFALRGPAQRVHRMHAGARTLRVRS